LPNAIDVTLILPAYNERASIRATIDGVVAFFRKRELTYEIIVSADGEDGTREIVSQMARSNDRLLVIGRAQRGGKGRAVREAVRISNGVIVGYADADNKVDISQFEQLEPHLRGGYDLVFGSRGLAQSKIERRQPWFRRLGSRGFGAFMHATVGLRGIRDTQCGFKFFQRAAALRIFEAQRIDGYMFDVEVLALAVDMGYRLKEVAIRWRDDGDSRLNLIGGNAQNFSDVLAIRRSRKALIKAAHLDAPGIRDTDTPSSHLMHSSANVVVRGARQCVPDDGQELPEG